MSQLKVIALISGGKDSLFSLLHCLAQGHQIVALANLYPSNVDTDDTDSYMYQTIGHNIIPLYEEALDLPLYRGAIVGDAVDKAQTYTHDAANATMQPDEIESLTSLLQRVMAHHPEANAVSTGAILSTYQRTRIESVAGRLGLIPLAFLWQYPYLPPYTQSSILHDMAAVGQDARIVKVASGGLDDRHLWLKVSQAETIRRLGRDMSRFGVGEVGAVLGEGGEYETLSLDGPDILWKGKILVTDTDREVRSIAGGSAATIIKKATVAEKHDRSTDDAQDLLLRLRKPKVWDDEFAKLHELMLSYTPPPNAGSMLSNTSTKNAVLHSDLTHTCKVMNSVTYVTNLTATSQTSVSSDTEWI